jgi:flagellin-specific chaperone FliS
MSMNRQDVYRANSVYTAPANVQIAQLHRQAAIWTKGIRADVSEGKIADGRQKIQYIQDIITFLRANLDFSFEVSRKAESTYIYHYKVLVDWFLYPQHVIDNEDEYQAMVAFWESWAKTWASVPAK